MSVRPRACEKCLLGVRIFLRHGGSLLAASGGISAILRTSRRICFTKGCCLQLSGPKMRRQWSKMVSTRTTKVMGSVEAKKDEDVLPVIEAYIKGQRIQKVYVDGGAQVCVMSEKMMNRD